MNPFSNGPSQEGPKPLRAALAVIAGAILWLGALASPALAQYTVQAGKSVQISIPPAPHQGSWDGPRDDGWANGRAPLQGTISYPDMQSGMLTGTATYTARANASGSDYIQWAFRCEPVGTPWPCGGGSATITIIPAKPSINDGSITVQYGASGTVTFSPSPDGVLSIKTPPANGKVTIDGRIATYRGNPGFSGSDSFRVVATNAGGESQPANVFVTVQAPPVPTTAGPETANTVANQSVRVSYTTTFADSLELLLAPDQGTATIDGNDVVYTPAKDWLGTDGYAVRSRGPGGISIFVRTEVTVVAPPPPVLTGGSLSLAFNATGSHDFAPTNGGTLALASAPSHGVVTISGGRATYTPNADYIGPDSYSVTGENLGGKSNPATVNVTVAPPPIPTLTGGSLSLAFNTPGDHDFAPTSGGMLALASAPSHGVVMISGGRATYTPNADYIGSDSYSVTGENLGGKSNPVTVSVTVSKPNAPGAGSASLTTKFETSGEVSLPVTGIFSTVTIVAQPENGVVTINGTLASFTPSLGFYGDDEFSYLATGYGGDSGVATVALKVLRPDAPTISAPAAVQTAFGQAVTIPLTVSGIVDHLKTDPAPTNGTATITGNDVVYQPRPGFAGREILKIVAVGPGGDSLAAEVAINVDAETVAPLPVEPPKTQPTEIRQDGQSGSPMRFRVAEGVSAVRSVLLTSPPATGTAAVEKLDVVYSPPADFVGSVAIGYQLIREEGEPVAGTLTANVHAPASEAPVKAAEATTDTPALVDLTEGVEGGPFSDAAIVSMSPALAGSAELVRAPSMAARSSMRSAKALSSASAPPEETASFSLRFTPAEDYYGDVLIRYSLTNRYGAPTSGVVRIAVDTRADPTRDAKVAATVNAQAQAATLFATSQLSNASRRLESARAGTRAQLGVSLSAARPTVNEPFVDQSRHAMLSELRDAVAPEPTGATPEPPQPASGKRGRIEVWTGGVVTLGERRLNGEGGGFDFTTSGVSLGADYRVSERLIIGAGSGFGRDLSDLGDGAKTKGHSYSAFAYLSYKPAPAWFVDTVIGAGRMEFETIRLTPSGVALEGSRTGDQVFGSVAAGLELETGEWRVSPYGRIEAVRSTLNAYAERGDGAAALRFAAVEIDQQSGILGVRGSYRILADLGVIEPTFRGEYRWSLRKPNAAHVSYANGREGTSYRMPLTAFDDQSLVLGLGMQIKAHGGWRAWLEWEASVRNDQGHTNALRAGGSLPF